MTRIIGILLDRSRFNKMPYYKGHEKLEFYNLAAKYNNITPFYMTLSNINTINGTAKGYMYINGKYIYQTRSIPRIVHNRSMTSNPTMKKRLKILSKKSYIYNLHTRYTKYQVHQLLSRSPHINIHLPQTVLFSKGNLDLMMNRFNSLFIKPTNGSIGLGIIKIWKVHEYKDKWSIQIGNRIALINKESIYSIIKKKIKSRVYIIQEAILLATLNGNPFDIRVSVQKDGSGKWQVTGMVAKVAKTGKSVTNVARGGKVYLLEPLIKANGFNVSDKLAEIEKLSLDIARYLSKNVKNIADIGLDVGFDQKGTLYFIELNARDLRYSFQEAGLYKVWYETYKKPMQYGRYLYDLLGKETYN